MLQANLQLQSLDQRSPQMRPASSQQAQRSQYRTAPTMSLESVCESLPANLSANKRAVINRLVALHQQGLLG